MTTPVIAIIGAGNMGHSLISGLIHDGHPADKLWATDMSTDKLEQLQQAFSIHTTSDNHQAVEQANVVVFAIKPQVFADIAIPLVDVIQTRKPLVLSVAAGVREASIKHWIGDGISIVRCMPNTAALIGCGATALFANAHVTDEERSLAESILRAVGVVVWLPHENLMDTVTALSEQRSCLFFPHDGIVRTKLPNN